MHPPLCALCPRHAHPVNTLSAYITWQGCPGCAPRLPNASALHCWASVPGLQLSVVTCCSGSAQQATRLSTQPFRVEWWKDQPRAFHFSSRELGKVLVACGPLVPPAQSSSDHYPLTASVCLCIHLRLPYAHLPVFSLSLLHCIRLRHLPWPFSRLRTPVCLHPRCFRLLPNYYAIATAASCALFEQ